MTDLQVRQTRDLSPEDLLAIRSLLDVSFDGAFTDDDWEHTLGGVHVFVRQDAAVISHAAIVERRLLADDTALKTGYVEGVATTPERRHRGLASAVMREANRIISASFDLGALSTDIHDLYLALGWERWEGPTFVDTAHGRVRTEDEDAGIMVLRTSKTADVRLTCSLTCNARRGDAW